MTYAELEEWAQFFAMEPWGFEMDWYRTGTIAAAIVNASPNRKRGKSASPQDYVPKLKPVSQKKPKKASVDESVEAIVAALGGKGVIRKDRARGNQD